MSLVARLSPRGRPASLEIARLARVVDVLASRRNQFFAPVAALLMVGTHTAWAVERWRARCGPAVAAWVDAVGEYETLAALAGLAFDHPDYAWPEVVEGPPRFEADDVAHPLLPATRAVANTVRLGGADPHVLLVSGSNMSGKSTLLRTVGVTIALAHAGGPVPARRLTMTPLAVGATLRVQDSLQEGQSRFFAEISRIAAIVRLAREAAADAGRPRVIFLLDEVLAGTNSHDRQEGAAAIIRGLVDLGAIGLITTHDLALTGMADVLGRWRRTCTSRTASRVRPCTSTTGAPRRRPHEQRPGADAFGRPRRKIAGAAVRCRAADESWTTRSSASSIWTSADPATRTRLDAPVRDSSDLVTHAVIVGMTGSGKTGLGIGVIEEAAIDGIPVLAIDPKGDLANLLLTFPGLSGPEFAPWVNEDEARAAGRPPRASGAAEAARWSTGRPSGTRTARASRACAPPPTSPSTPPARASAGRCRSAIRSPRRRPPCSTMPTCWGIGRRRRQRAC